MMNNRCSHVHFFILWYNHLSLTFSADHIVFYTACPCLELKAVVVFSFRQMSLGPRIGLPMYRRVSPSEVQFQCCLSKLRLSQTNANLQHICEGFLEGHQKIQNLKSFQYADGRFCMTKGAQ